jgi:inner membrane protein
MDSLTQIVLGAAVGEAVLGKKIGNRAMLWGAIAGTIPDLDVFIKLFTDPITANELHRGISHSLFFSIVMAPILGWLVHKIYRKRGEAVTVKDWSWLFFGSLVTHPLLDAHTNWGTQFFWPFEYRLAYNNIFVADPIYTLPFLVFVIIAMCYKRDNPKRRKFNNWGLIVSTTYMALTLIFKGITFSKFAEALRDQELSYTEMDTQTTPLNAILWNAQVETKNGYRFAYYSFFDKKPIRFSPEIPKNAELLKPYLNQKVIKQLIKISTGWFVVRKDGDDLIFTDIRFGQFGFEDDSPFFWNYKLRLGADGIMTAVQLKDVQNKADFGKAFSNLGKRIKGN